MIDTSGCGVQMYNNALQRSGDNQKLRYCGLVICGNGDGTSRIRLSELSAHTGFSGSRSSRVVRLWQAVREAAARWAIPAARAATVNTSKKGAVVYLPHRSFAGRHSRQPNGTAASAPLQSVHVTVCYCTISLSVFYVMSSVT